MAIPVLELNLTSPPTLWRQHHGMIGWAALALGALALAASLSVSILAYRDANLAGRDAVLKTSEARDVIHQQQVIEDGLKKVDVEKELPKWKLAERILTERSLPWSRLTAELERSLVQDVRLTSIQRTRSSAQAVELKIAGEAKARTSEESFVDSLRGNPFFNQVILERESERQGGGINFEYTLTISPTPPAYEPLPEYGPVRSPQAAVPAPAAKPVPPVPVTAKPMIIPPSAPSSPVQPKPLPPIAPPIHRPPLGVRPGSPGYPQPPNDSDKGGRP
jgi:hypothetical protein